MKLFHYSNKKGLNKKERRNRAAHRKCLADLMEQIESSKQAILSAQNQFEFVVEPTLIDCCIFELNAANLRYQFLLQTLKKQETLSETDSVLSCEIPISCPSPRQAAGPSFRWQNNCRLPRQLEV